MNITFEVVQNPRTGSWSVVVKWNGEETVLLIEAPTAKAAYEQFVGSLNS